MEKESEQEQPEVEEEEPEIAETAEEAEVEEEAEEIPQEEEIAEAEAEEAPEPIEEAPPAVEEEAKPPAREKIEEEEEIVEERIYTIPLGKVWIMPPNKRAPRAMRMIRSFITKHMKLEARREGEEEEAGEPKKLTISNEVNEKVWRKGIQKPPRKIRVRAAKDKEGNVTVYLGEGD